MSDDRILCRAHLNFQRDVSLPRLASCSFFAEKYISRAIRNAYVKRANLRTKNKKENEFLFELIRSQTIHT